MAWCRFFIKTALNTADSWTCDGASVLVGSRQALYELFCTGGGDIVIFFFVFFFGDGNESMGMSGHDVHNKDRFPGTLV